MSPTRGRQIQWERNRLVHHDVVMELQRVQEFENQSLEMWKYVI